MPERRLVALLAAAAVALAALAGCGEETKRSAASPLVDPSKRPFINTLEIDPDDGTILITTNKGFFRIPKGEDRARRARSRIVQGNKSGPVGTFLAIKALPGGEYVGSGHPDVKGQGFPEYLGFLRSKDYGKTWRPVSRMGLADLHVLHILHDRLYVFDAVLGGLLISEDEGRTWEERFTPRGQLVIDFVVDPTDPQYILASTDETLYRSEDEGKSWRSIGPSASTRLAWPAPDKLYRADKDGRVQISDDKGEGWEDVGKIDGEPWKMKAQGPDELHVALSDASVHRTEDGGRSWDAVFTP